MSQLELVDRLLDMNKSTFFSHQLGGEVRVTASSIPVSSDRLRVERKTYVKVFGDPLEDVPRYP